MTKLLICGGCSNTDQRYYGYQQANVFTWPHLVAEELECDYINVAKEGCDNDTIANNIYDAVMANQDRELEVMVFWTEPCRYSLWGTEWIRIHGNIDLYDYLGMEEFIRVDKEQWKNRLKNYRDMPIADFMDDRDYALDDDVVTSFDIVTKYEFLFHALTKELMTFNSYRDRAAKDIEIVNYSIRAVERTKKLLDLMNIPNTHHLSLSWVFNVPWIMPFWKHDPLTNVHRGQLISRFENLNTYLQQHPLIKEFGWEEEIDAGLVSKEMKEKGMCLPCGHLNQKGMEQVAKTFIDSRR